MQIREPFEAHNHFRDGAMMRAIAGYTARRFPRGAVAMPNLAPQPVTTPEMAVAYKQRILDALGIPDYPLIMTGYLTEDMSPETVVRGFQSGAWQAMKFYPHGLTTNSHGGIKDIEKLAHVFGVMEEIGMPALFHGERGKKVNNDRIDIYDREAAFFDLDATWLLRTFPGLKISFEHGSTRAFAQFLLDYGGELVGGTITIQHLMFDRNDFFADGPDVHLHCYPVLKRQEDLEILRAFATAGHQFIFAGTDSAPHPTHAKERACGCAGGVFTAHAAVELYTQIFEEEGALIHLEGFLSLNGPQFYGLAPSEKFVTLVKEPWTVNAMIPVEGGDMVRPLFYHEKREHQRILEWTLLG